MRGAAYTHLHIIDEEKISIHAPHAGSGDNRSDKAY